MTSTPSSSPTPAPKPTRASSPRSAKRSRWCRGYNYKQMIAHCFKSMADMGMTHAEIGRALADSEGPLRANVVSMHMYADNPVSPYPNDRIPALADYVKLKPIDCVRLMRQRAINHPKNASATSVETYDWLLGKTLKASRDVIGEAKAKDSGVSGETSVSGDDHAE